MPRVAVNAATSKSAGTKLIDEADGDPANGHVITNTGKTRLLVRNANGAATARTITFNFSRTVDGQGVTDRAVPIPAGETWIFGPFGVSDYGSQLLVDVDNAELKLRVIE